MRLISHRLLLVLIPLLTVAVEQTNALRPDVIAVTGSVPKPDERSALIG